MLYLSYHNTDLHYVTELVSALNKFNKHLWFDRHYIHLLDDWSLQVADAMANADFALVFLSPHYARSSYCLEELAQLQSSETKIIGIVVEDFELSTIVEVAEFSEFFDLNSRQNKPKFEADFLTCLANIGLDLHPIVASERRSYVNLLINELEIRLQNTTTNHTHIVRSDGIPYKGKTIRSRGYLPDLLTQGSYSLYIDGEELTLENLISLIDVQPNNIIQGVVGTGKSTIALLIALWGAHQYREHETSPLPIYLDFADWGSDQTFESFISSQWQLAYDWRAWLAKNPALFILELDDVAVYEHPDYLDHVFELCVVPEHHTLVLVTPECTYDFDSKYSIAYVTVRPLSHALIKKMAYAFLPDNQAEKLLTLYKSVSSGRSERQIDYVSFMIELLNSGYDESLETFPRHFAAHVVWQRWQHLLGLIQLPFSFDELLNALKYLAWHMLDSETPYAMSYFDALNQVGDSALVEISIDLGILQRVGNRIRFQARLIQIDLAAYILLADGIYKYLTKASFDTEPLRVESKWDRAILATFNVIEPEQRDDILELIDDVDPFLAIEFAQQDKKLFQKYLYQLISKLIDVRRKNPDSHHALINTLNSIPFINDTAQCLIGLIGNSSWSEQVLLHELLIQLPFVVPDDILAQVYDLDRDFDDSRIALLATYPVTQWIVFLSLLVEHPDPTVKRNAIRLLGDTNDLRSLPTLFSLLTSNLKSIVLDTISSIVNITNDDSYLARLLSSLSVEFHQPDTISQIFLNMGRDFSSKVMDILHVSETNYYPEFFIALSHVPETSVKAVIAKHIEININEFEVLQKKQIEGDYAMKLNDLIRRRLQETKDKSTLDRLYEEITRVFLKPASESDSNDSKTTQLVERTKSSLQQAVSEHTGMDENDIDNSISSAVLEKLYHEDWLIRYRALQELAGYSTEQIMPYLINAATDDRDIQVRIGALGILANLPYSDQIQRMLLNALEDPDHHVIDATVDFIKKLEQFETARVITLLKHPNLHTIVAAIEILSVHHTQDAVTPLIHMLADERKPWLGEEPLGFFAAKALRLIGTPEALDAVKQSNFLNEPDQTDIIPPAIERPNQSSKAYTAEQKVQLTLVALRGDKWELAQKAARYLRRLAKSMQGTSNIQIITMLEDALTDDAWTVRWAVVEALAWIKSPSSVEKIISLLQDENWMVQVASIRSLIELNSWDAAPHIAKLLHHSNSAVSEAAAEALGILKNPAVIDQLQESLHAEDEFVRLSAIQSIYQILEEEAATYLLEMLHDPYNHIRWFAIKHLSTETNPQAVDSIARLLPDKSGPAWEKHTISDYAVQALKNANTPESIRILNEWIRQTTEK